MANTQPSPNSDPTAQHSDFDVILIGAGVTGLVQLYRLRQLGLSVRCFEAGSDVGGTWYWNRYPGARFDSESYSYGYSFSEELLQEWEWSEHFAPQPETLRYLQHVADKFDLRRDIQFNTRIEGAHWDEAGQSWEVQTEAGERVRARFLITAVGVLSATQLPDIEGIESFEGDAFHTSQWPHEPVDFTGKRVGVIGTGATAVQLIPEVAKQCGHLTVFQRTPQYCLPLRNRPIDAETQRELKARYPEIFAQCARTFAGLLHEFDERSALEVSAEERRAKYEELYQQPGFALWLGSFYDIFSDLEANQTITEFVREKIREQIDDPTVAEKLVPKDYPFGTKRVPMESGYYEAFNRDNVLLVDLQETPIERITPRGVQTKGAEYEVDILIYATGFDAVTGSLTRLDIRGEEGISLREKWVDGPKSYLGFQSVGFPNFFTLIGPLNGGTFCNMPRCSEHNADWVTECLGYMRENGLTRIAATQDAEEAWVEHVAEGVKDTLLHLGNSWFFGANTPGKKKQFLMYAGGAPAFRAKCEEVAAKGYEGFVLS